MRQFRVLLRSRASGKKLQSAYKVNHKWWLYIYEYDTDTDVERDYDGKRNSKLRFRNMEVNQRTHENFGVRKERITHLNRSEV